MSDKPKCDLFRVLSDYIVFHNCIPFQDAIKAAVELSRRADIHGSAWPVYVESDQRETIAIAYEKQLFLRADITVEAINRIRKSSDIDLVNDK